MLVAIIVLVVLALVVIGSFIQGYSQVGTYKEMRRIRKQNERR